MAEPDRDDAVEPTVFVRRRLEERCDAEIILRRIDRLAAVEAVEHRRRPVAEAAIGHADEVPVVGLEGEADVELQGAGWPSPDPVGAAGLLDRAAELRSLEAAAGNDADAALAERRPAEVLDLRDLKRDGEEWRGADIHGLASPAVSGDDATDGGNLI